MQANGAGDNDKCSFLPSGVNSYSNAFERFFKGNDDIVGALAYCFYKQQKRDFIMLNHIDSTHERVREYHFDLNDTRVAQLRENAAQKINAFTQNVSDKTAEELESVIVEGVLMDAFNRHGKRIKKLVEAVESGNQNILNEIEVTNQRVVNGTKWWKSVLASVAASFVFGLVLTWAKVINWTNPLASDPSPQTTSESRQ
jgi:hypothetical protein